MDGVSVVICCYNSAKRLPEVLEHLGRQEAADGIKWEVLVVDNASTDNTALVAVQNWKRDNVPLRVITEPEPGLSNARKAGLKASRYSLVSFVDDDNWVEKFWISKVHNWFLENVNTGLLGGHGRAYIEGEKPEWFDRFQRSYAVGPQGTATGKSSSCLYGAGLTIRKSIWEELHSNNFRFILSGRKGKALTSGEDHELCLAVKLAGYDICYDAGLEFYHFMPRERLSWEYLVDLARSFGRTDPVINIYISSVNGLSGLSRAIRENRWMVVLFSIYWFMRSWPGYIRIIGKSREGLAAYRVFHRSKSRMLESFRLFFRFPSMVSHVRYGQWRKTAGRKEIPDTHFKESRNLHQVKINIARDD